MTVNLTIENLTEEESYHLENMLRKHYEVKDFKVLPDTKNLYDTDTVFKKLVKGVKDAQLIRDRYINSKK